MKHKLEQALNEVSDTYIHEAGTFRKKRRLAPWLGTVAAVLAVAIVAATLWNPAHSGAGSIASTTSPTQTTTLVAPVLPNTVSSDIGAIKTRAVASPVYPVLCAYPLEDQTGDYSQWWDDQRAMHDQPEGYADSLQSYFAKSVPLLLSDTDGKNTVCSPPSIYMALAMLAEVTDGESRQQILELLNADGIESLREQAGHVWRGHYNNDGLTTSILGTSLWLDTDYTCIQETTDLLAERYFASVFHEDLGSEEANTMLRNWLSDQTGGLLDDYVAGIELDPRTALALASSIYYKVQWQDEFHESANRKGIFHSTAGDTEATFMNRSLMFSDYYWGEGFGAVRVTLRDNSNMWLFLPDEGVTPEQLMNSGEIFGFLAQDPIFSDDFQNRKNVQVNLSIPKFDIDFQTDLVQQLQELGVTDVFQPGIADFTPILEEGREIFVGDAKHAARVAIDEKGVTAAAYTVIMAYGAGGPPDEKVDFVLDRPFVFVIESQDGLPLFAGIVNQP